MAALILQNELLTDLLKGSMSLITVCLQLSWVYSLSVTIFSQELGNYQRHKTQPKHYISHNQTPVLTSADKIFCQCVWWESQKHKLRPLHLNNMSNMLRQKMNENLTLWFHMSFLPVTATSGTFGALDDCLQFKGDVSSWCDTEAPEALTSTNTSLFGARALEMQTAVHQSGHVIHVRSRHDQWKEEVCVARTIP